MTVELLKLGEIPPIGIVPERMHASVIRPERYGEPRDAFKSETMPVPRPGRGQLLVLVMAAGINYNNVWAARGAPADVIAARQRAGETEDFHLGGSEGSGVVWAVGDGVKQSKVGDCVVMSAGLWDETAADVRLGADPMTSTTAKVWGYETNYGCFAQFTVVEEYQCVPKPPHLTWEEAACYISTGVTAYRQLNGWPPHVVRPGDPVLIWGGAGGLGSMAIQITKALGGLPIAVVSSAERVERCLKLGAKGAINRLDFHHWGRLPDPDDGPRNAEWTKEVQRFGRRFWELLGERRNPRIVFEHSGKDTLPTSIYLCDRGGMVVACGATSGYVTDLDLRFLWMRQKRLQGSHFGTLQQCHAITHMVAQKLVDPCLTWVGGFEDIGEAHQMMSDNRHTGNIAVLINAPRSGLTDLRP